MASFHIKMVVLFWTIRECISQQMPFRPVKALNGSTLCATDACFDFELLTDVIGIPDGVPDDVRCAFQCTMRACVGFNVRNKGSPIAQCQFFSQTPINYRYTTGCSHFQIPDNNSPGAQSLAQLSVVGCFKDCQQGMAENRRSLPYARTATNSNSLGSCRYHCYTLGYSFAGAQYSKECRCGYTLPTTTSNSCTMACSGMPTQICGGPCANTVMITGI